MDINYICEHCWIQLPLWPNGEGTGLLNQGLWVRVPPGVLVTFFF